MSRLSISSRLSVTSLLAVAVTLVPALLHAQPDLDERLLLASPSTIDADPALLAHMTELAEPAYAANCASCHGANFAGSAGVPNLADYD